MSKTLPTDCREMLESVYGEVSNILESAATHGEVLQQLTYLHARIDRFLNPKEVTALPSVEVLVKSADEVHIRTLRASLYSTKAAGLVDAYVTQRLGGAWYATSETKDQDTQTRYIVAQRKNPRVKMPPMPDDPSLYPEWVASLTEEQRVIALKRLGA